MKLTKLYKMTFVSLFLLGFTMLGCFPDNSSSYDGPLQVEFKSTSDTQRMSDGDIYNATIQLIGPHQDTDITVGFEVDTDKSTAVLDQHFELSGFTAVIPANSSFGTITIQAITANVDASRPIVVLNLLGSADGKVKAAKNYKTLELTLRP